MTGRIDARLAELGLTLPDVTTPVANYVPFVRVGDLLILSGQIPLADGKPAFTGLLGAGVTVAEGQAAARLCAVNLLAQVRAACDGDLDRVVQVVRLGVFVAGTPDFGDHPKVANGASDLMVDVFGDAGRHARAAVGCPSLPLGVPVEVEGTVRLTGS